MLAWVMLPPQILVKKHPSFPSQLCLCMVSKSFFLLSHFSHVDPNSKKQRVKLEKMRYKLIKRWEEEKLQKDLIALTAVNGSRFMRGAAIGASGRPLLAPASDEPIDNIPETKFAPYPSSEAKSVSVEPVLYPSIRGNKVVSRFFYRHIHFIQILIPSDVKAMTVSSHNNAPVVIADGVHSR